MNTKTTFVSLGLIRIINFIFLFILSAVAKVYPSLFGDQYPSPYFAITTFEAKQLVPLGFDQCYGAYFSRLLISFEFALGYSHSSAFLFKANCYTSYNFVAQCFLCSPLSFCFRNYGRCCELWLLW